jgi:hypothetical protein
LALSVNTRDTFKYTLIQHRDLKAADQPFLRFRFVSARDAARMDQLFDQAKAADDVGQILKLAMEGIQIALAGWWGFETQFNPSDLDLVLSRADIMELVRELPEALTVSQFEKKASALRSLSTSDKSAEEAPTAAA